MPEKLVDLDAIRRAETKLDQLLREHPELRESNPERQQALAEWLDALDQKDTTHG